MKACEAAAAAEAVGAGAIVDEWGYTELTVSYASLRTTCLCNARRMIVVRTIRMVEFDVTRRLEKMVDITTQ